MKFDSLMRLSKDTKLCSNQVCLTYFHRIKLMSVLAVTEYAYLQCISVSQGYITFLLLIHTSLNNKGQMKL